MGPSATSDAELIAQLRSGTVEENKALETIYRIHFPVIAGYVKRNSGDRDAARDVFQDGVVVLYRHVKQGRFAAESSLGTYLYSICRFLWLKQLRAHGRLTGHEPSHDVIEDQPLSRSLSDGAGLAALFEQLGEVCRRVLLLRYFEGLDMRTIAARTGFKDEQNARNKKSKCLKGLRALIARDPSAAQWFNELREP